MKVQLLILAALIGMAQIAPVATCSMIDCRCGVPPAARAPDDAPISGGCCGEEPEPSETETPSDHQDCDGSCLVGKPLQDAERSIQSSPVPDSATSLAHQVPDLHKKEAFAPLLPHRPPYVSRASPTGRLLHLVFSTFLI